VKDYFSRTMKILNDSVASMDMDEFERLVAGCVRTLENGGKVIVSGLGKNVPICEKFTGSMISMNQKASFMHTSSAVHGDLGMVQPGDLVIMLTKSGETTESVYLYGLLEARNTELWLITFTAKSTLAAKISNKIILSLQDEGDMWNIAPNNSTTVNLIVLQGLAMEIAARRGVTLAQFKKNHPGGHIGEILKNIS
jgi:arabinose-5-phosphate isomerase